MEKGDGAVEHGKDPGRACADTEEHDSGYGRYAEAGCQKEAAAEVSEEAHIENGPKHGEGGIACKKGAVGLGREPECVLVDVGRDGKIRHEGHDREREDCQERTEALVAKHVAYAQEHPEGWSLRGPAQGFTEKEAGKHGHKA